MHFEQAAGILPLLGCGKGGCLEGSFPGVAALGKEVFSGVFSSFFARFKRFL